MLLVASYFFYGCWDYRFLSLILISTVIDYVSGIKIQGSEKRRTRRFFLVLSMCTNLGLLGAFKYFDFFAENLQVMLSAVGFKTSVGRLRIILPVGISFYTFQTMSYTIDIFRRKLEPTRRLRDFALFVACFPEPLAGPIERAKRLLPQVLKERHFSRPQFLEGLHLIVWGLFKKMVVADNMARIVDYVFGMPAGSLTGLEIFLGICAFAFQIYGDFSGYSDIARGTAKCLGFEIMVNFKRPYFALNPSDFWQRWHVSLSSWLRDYLYISLGGNRRGKLNTYRNLALTMLLGGLWHGAGWTFIAWGAFHGLILILYRLGGEKKKTPENSERKSSVIRRVSVVFRWATMLCLVLISWLLFRAQSMHQVGIMFVQMFSSWQITPMAMLFIRNIIFFSWFLVLVDTWDFIHEGKENAPKLSFFVKFTFFLYCISSILFFGMFEAQQFIYFQF